MRQQIGQNATEIKGNIKLTPVKVNMIVKP
ncbi:MAG: hypothetical protein CM1200mP30_31280 [Pseudomonadota bacterium]|nr:MAG: hypothetical protein CM1200mP30_31280 [Pseudomonadota bacterium]